MMGMSVQHGRNAHRWVFPGARQCGGEVGLSRECVPCAVLQGCQG